MRVNVDMDSATGNLRFDAVVPEAVEEEQSLLA
jgi:hypothetical protein